MKSLTLSILVLASLVIAQDLSKDQECFESIYEAYGHLTFEGEDPAEYYAGPCTLPVKTCSIYASAKLYCTEHEIDRGQPVVAGYCKEYGMVDMLLESDCTGNYSISDDRLASFHVVDVNEMLMAKNYSEIVVLSSDLYGLTHRTVEDWEGEMWAHHTYGWAMYGFWGIVLLIGIMQNLYNTFWHRRAKVSTHDEEGHVQRGTPSTGLIARSWRIVRAHLVLPSVFGTYHHRLLYGATVPTRAEAFVIYAYWIISLVLCAVNYKTFAGNLYWARIPPQVWRYLADRTGIMAYANLPWLWAFAGRNNIFIWATGWDFARFNLFHRQVARVATLEAIVHSIAYTVLEVDDGGYALAVKERYFWCGMLATIAMSLLLLASSIVLRKKVYELFLLIHIALSIVTIVALWYHTYIFDGEYDGYLWPLVAIWCFDRFLRLVRLIYCNLRVSFGSKDLKTSSTTAVYLADADVIKLTVTYPQTMLKPRPGQFYYIYRPFSWKGWENHPFTLGSYSTGSQIGSVAQTFSDATPKKSLDIGTSPQSGSSVPSFEQDRSNTEYTVQQTLVFWLRPFDGWTKELRDRCRRSPTSSTKARMLVEGPYGHDPKLMNYEHILLIVGGTGLSAAIPHIEEYLRREKSGAPKRTQVIALIWACRQPEFIHELCGSELKPALDRPDIQMSFFSTSVVHTTARSASIDEVAVDSGAAEERVSVKINHGRPDVRGSILAAAKASVDGGSKAGHLAVLVCGPAGMADEARSAVHQALKDGCSAIEYVEETFGW